MHQGSALREEKNNRDFDSIWSMAVRWWRLKGRGRVLLQEKEKHKTHNNTACHNVSHAVSASEMFLLFDLFPDLRWPISAHFLLKQD